MDSPLTRPIPPLRDLQTGRRVDCDCLDEPLVDLAEVSSGAILCELEYAKQSDLAPNVCYVRSGVAEKLIEAQGLLPEGVRLLVFDAWRPREIQKQLFEDYQAALESDNPDWNAQRVRDAAARFVTDPEAVTPPHCTGGAVDLTLADDAGAHLWFGSGFDEFTPASATRFFEEAVEAGTVLNDRELEALANRRLLYNVLTLAGMTNYPAEWWHFDYGDSLWAQSVGERALYGAIDAPDGE